MKFVNGALFAICFFLVFMGVVGVVVAVISLSRPVQGISPYIRLLTIALIHLLMIALGVTYFAVKIRLEKKTADRTGDTRLMTEPEHTPVFRRFPWVQLVFCLACLSMAAWLWMRYSYCWRYTPDDLDYDLSGTSQGDWPRGAYVELSFGHSDLRASPQLKPEYLVLLSDEAHGYSVGPITDPRGSQGTGHGIRALRARIRDSLVSSIAQVEGCTGDVLVRFSGFPPSSGALDPSSSQVLPRSVAGLVVGAMGCFIFGLYLRRWLRERKALASQPGVDMTA
ncbi:MAG: hypothetical protein ACYS9X_00615 [Planctomycetota bacterium]